MQVFIFPISSLPVFSLKSVSDTAPGERYHSAFRRCCLKAGLCKVITSQAQSLDNGLQEFGAFS